METLARLNLLIGVLLLVLGVGASVILVWVFIVVPFGESGRPFDPLALLHPVALIAMLGPLVPGALLVWAGRLARRRSSLWPWVQIPAVLVAMVGLLLWRRSLLIVGSFVILVGAIVLFGLLSRRHPRSNG